MYDVIVVGCGASGAISSIFASSRGLSVAVLEASERGMKKLLTTGNGRCNITNKNIDKSCYSGSGKAIFDNVYSSFNNEKTLEYLRSIGIETIELEDGKMYPMSLQAASVVNNLLDEMNKNGVTIISDFPVTKISVGKHFSVYSNDRKISAKSVIIASGSKSGTKENKFNSMIKVLKELNIKTTKTYPSLVQIKSDYKYLKHLNGTKIKTDAKLINNGKIVKSFYGEVLFANYGLSGIPIMNLSRFFTRTNKKDYFIELDLMYGITYDELFNMLKVRKQNLSHKTLDKFFVGVLPKSLIVPTIKDNDLIASSLCIELSDKDLTKICTYLKKFTIRATDTNGFNRSQAMAGGVSVQNLNDDLSHKKYKNLYFCGEIVDIDGMCGGYNLQWAWSSGYVVGNSVLK